MADAMRRDRREAARDSDKIRLIGDRGSILVATPLQSASGDGGHSVIDAISEIQGQVEIAGNLCDIGKKELLDNPDFVEEMLWLTVPGTGVCTRQVAPDKKSGRFIYPKSDKAACEATLTRTLLTKWKYFAEREPQKAVRWCESDSLTWGDEHPPTVEIISHKLPFREKIKEGATHSAWSGQIKVSGHTAWQRLVWDCGLGTRTGLGLGMVEPSNK